MAYVNVEIDNNEINFSGPFPCHEGEYCQNHTPNFYYIDNGRFAKNKRMGHPIKGDTVGLYLTSDEPTTSYNINIGPYYGLMESEVAKNNGFKPIRDNSFTNFMERIGVQLNSMVLINLIKTIKEFNMIHKLYGYDVYKLVPEIQMYIPAAKHLGCLVSMNNQKLFNMVSNYIALNLDDTKIKQSMEIPFNLEHGFRRKLIEYMRQLGYEDIYVQPGNTIGITEVSFNIPLKYISLE